MQTTQSKPSTVKRRRNRAAAAVTNTAAAALERIAHATTATTQHAAARSSRYATDATNATNDETMALYAMQEISESEREIARDYLAALSQSSSVTAAARAVGVSVATPFAWRERCPAFGAVFDRLRRRAEAARVAAIEDSMSRRAIEDGDTRAAAIILPAWDSRYRATAAPATQAVQIHISI